jgi:hypothetical protein
VLAVFDRPDAEIRTEIREQIIRDAFLSDPDAFGVIVKDGVVTLTGRPELDLRTEAEVRAAYRKLGAELDGIRPLSAASQAESAVDAKLLTRQPNRQ